MLSKYPIGNTEQVFALDRTYYGTAQRAIPQTGYDVTVTSGNQGKVQQLRVLGEGSSNTRSNLKKCNGESFLFGYNHGNKNK